MAAIPDPTDQTAAAPLQRAVEVMDRLRAPGGCPWDATQTHRSLARYLVEECYEVVEAIETDDPVLLREELGDLLLQVLFHARIAQERPAPDGFDVDDVAADLVAKLVGRHPHVFGPDEGVRTPEQLDEIWEQRKRVEKGRTSAVDGVPVGQPALALAAKLVSRATRAGVVPDPTPPRTGDSDDGNGAAEIGERLFTVVRDAVAAGVDPETALRNRARVYRAAVVAEESRSAPT
ncbi:XTP/dITP diphosphohydrolase [Jatrophihabitans endophyticus]|uniref:XTP/dITP diphosphohydrolase n=1 Tax=Jatrophihabitans endophyticus TaxID=1206085 RepID=A0A1M5U946_9ACTN|nr:MazG family protein [Jatrophihabitans endophyticus]SHH59441.1 XTP/dITP diphosphohydrolase [Jatrophihabitans endophyticus]